MKYIIFSAAILIWIQSASAQQPLSASKEISVNGFRNPSIGLEYRHHRVSVHAGYYTTAFESGAYTNFFRSGFSYWFLATDQKAIPSSFYAGASYLRGLNRDYKDLNAFGVEAGYRWMIWKGLQFRIGVIGVAAKGQSLKINPTPGISYSFTL